VLLADVFVQDPRDKVTVHEMTSMSIMLAVARSQIVVLRAAEGCTGRVADCDGFY